MEELETQLHQMKTALQVASEEDKPALESIIKDLEDLINSCSSTTCSIISDVNVSNSNQNGLLNESELDEYTKFQAEIAALENSDSETTASSSKDPSAACSSRSSVQFGDETEDSPSNCISDELAALEGMKCMAPHEESWGQIGFYPAMISQVVPSTSGDSDENEDSMNSMESIMVRVLFLQPVVKSQLFCPFFKEDRCRFADHECRFSHGEVVPLSQLREYSEPDYSKIVPGARVLAKYSDDLWYKAIVTRLTNEGICEVQYDKDKEVFELAMHEMTPLHHSSDGSTSTSDSEEIEDDDDIKKSSSSFINASTFAPEDIMKMTATEALGDWEKYTKGFGSKLMLKMGYVMGTGLGRNAEGRVNPVDAVVLPPGMSLDKWMNIKEKAGGDRNWFTVEKRLKRAQKKHAHQEKQKSEHSNQKSSVFDFMNKLCVRKNTIKTKSNIESVEKINKQTASNLNKKMLHIGENMRKVCKDIRKINDSIKRLEGRDPSTLAKMKEKLGSLEKELRDLSQMENKIANEQKSRSDKRKLTEF